MDALELLERYNWHKMMLSRDHFAADIACLWNKIRVIECEVRSRPNHKAYKAIDDLADVMLEIEKLCQKWEDRIGTALPHPRKVSDEKNNHSRECE